MGMSNSVGVSRRGRIHFKVSRLAIALPCFGQATGGCEAILEDGMPFEVSNIVYVFIASHGLSFILGLIVWANLSRSAGKRRAAGVSAEASGAIEVMAKAPVAPTETAPQPAEAATEIVEQAQTQNNPIEAALVERNIWLEQRIAAVETELALKHPPVDLDAATGGGATGEDAAAIEEQLVRLRWRNRYLEGRVAYYEEGQEDDPAEASMFMDGDPDNELQAAEFEADSAPERDAPNAPVPPVFITPEKPATAAEPVGDKDDLTQITGIGPRIADVLNGLGIWSVSQISAWTPENIVWLERHLAFHGRISREDWVGQAGRLLGEREAG